MHVPRCFLMLGCLVLCCGLLPLCAAQHPSITILEPQATVTHTQQLANNTFRFYTFVVTLRNDGDVASDNITVYLADSDIPEFSTKGIAIGNCTLAPGASKSLTTTEYPITSQGAFYVNISYSPTTGNTNIYNSGQKSFIIGGTTTQNKSTPGFESAIAVLAVILAGMLYRRRTR
jgi:hypothetical protein